MSVKRTYGKLFTMGSSMGGYATLKYGSILQADKILSFVPESELYLNNGKSMYIRNKIYTKDNGDISKLNYKDNNYVYIITSGTDIIDLYSASKIKANSNIEVKVIKNIPHNVAGYLDNKGILKELIRDFFINNKFKSISIFNNFLNLEESLLLKTFNDELLKGKVNYKLKNKILKLINRFPDWIILHYFIGRIYIENNELNKAVLSLSKSISILKEHQAHTYYFLQAYFGIHKIENINLTINKLEEIIHKISIYFNREDKNKKNFIFPFSKYKEVDFELIEALLDNRQWVALYIIFNYINMKKNENYYYILGRMFVHFMQKDEALAAFAKSLSYNKKPNKALMQYAVTIFSIYNHKLITREVIMQPFISNNFKITTITFDLINKWFKSKYYKGCIVSCYLMDKELLNKKELSRYYYILAVSNRELDYYNEALLYYTLSLSCNQKPNDSLMGYATLIYDMYSKKKLDRETLLNTFSHIKYKYNFENITFSLVKYWSKQRYWKGVYIACLLLDVKNINKNEILEYKKILIKSLKCLENERKG